MGWDLGLQETMGGAMGSPGIGDVAAVALVCGVVYGMRHYGGTVAGTLTGTVTGTLTGLMGRLEALRRAARP